jgi:hypothetical protein
MDIEEARVEIRKLNRIIKGWQRHAERTAKTLGCIAIDEEIEKAVKRERRLREIAEGVVDHYAGNSNYLGNTDFAQTAKKEMEKLRSGNV